MATKLYLHDATTGNTGTLPSSTHSALTSNPSATPPATHLTQRSMTASIGTAQTSLAGTTQATVTAQAMHMGMWESLPLQGQTLPTGTWTLSFASSEANAASNYQTTFCLYVWRPSTGAMVGTALYDAAALATEPGTSETAATLTTGSLTGVAVTAGDILVCEIWRGSVAQGGAAARVNTFFYDGTTEASTSTCASFLECNAATAILFETPVSVTGVAAAVTATGGTPFSYRLWPATNGGALASYSGPFVGATQFAVAGGGNWLNGYYIWVPSGGDTSPSGGYNTALWSLITGASSGSGVLVPGSVVTGVTGLTANAWNFIPLATPIQLAAGWDSNATGNGSTYVAAVGWTAAAGFADTNGYWASGGGGGNGITSGPLIGYSSNTGASNKAPYGMAQGLFGDTTSNAASALPNQVSGTDNFWVDVQVCPTAPIAYAGTYRLWPDKYDANDFTTGDAAVNYTIATEISLAQACTLDYVWYWSPTSLNGSTAATTLATQCDVWNISTGLSVASITSPSWLTPSGGAASAGTGWVKAAFAGGTTLGTGDYRVSVYNSAGHTDANWSAKDASTDYWGETLTGTVGAAGITWGPVSAPDYASSQGGFVFSNGAAGPPPNAGSATSHAQAVFYQPATTSGAAGFPQLFAPVGGSSNETQNYWVDLEVTPSSGSAGAVTGVAAAVTAAGGTGTVSAGRNLTGVAAAVTAAGGTGTPGATHPVTGVAAPVTVAGGTGAVSASVKVTGVAAAVTAAGGTGTVSAARNLTGVAAPVTVAGGTGTVLAAVSIAGVAAPVTAAGGVGTAAGTGGGGQNVSGVAAAVTVAGGTGTASAGRNLTGTAALVTVAAGTGALSAAAHIAGMAALATVLGGTGTAHGGGAVTPAGSTASVTPASTSTSTVGPGGGSLATVVPAATTAATTGPGGTGTPAVQHQATSAPTVTHG